MPRPRSTRSSVSSPNSHRAGGHRRPLPRPAWWIAVDYLVSYLGYFALLPLLPKLLTREFKVSPSELGLILLAFSVSIRASSIFLAGLLDRLRLERALMTGLLLSAVGFSSASLASDPWEVLLCLTAAGVGISIHAVVARGLIATLVTAREPQLRAFSLINVAANVAAAAGPLLAGAMLSLSSDPPILLVASGCYLFSAALILTTLRLPPALLQPAGPGSETSPLRTYMRLFRDDEFRRLSAFNFVGWFMYAQLFSALPIYLFATIENPALVGTFFVLNGVLIIGLQMPVSRLTARLVSDASVSSRRVPLMLTASILCFAVSFLVIAAGAPVWTLYLAVALFTLGEMVFMPLSDSAFSWISGLDQTVVVFTGKRITTAIGEALGVLCGGSVFLTVTGEFGDAAYWYAIGAVGVGLALVAMHISVRPGVVGPTYEPSPLNGAS
jgi:DHA1 family multidrug resistance protein-like MFS transporter